MKMIIIVRCSTGKCHRAGFALIELLIALAIGSLVVAALYGTFFLSHKAVDVVDYSLLRLQESRALLDILKREIDSAFYDRGRAYCLFKIDDRDLYGRQASQLTFTAFSPLLPGLSRIQYIVEEEEEKMVLSKRIDSAYAPLRDEGSFVLIEDIESFTIEARYRDRWIRTWDSDLAQGVPDELRISFTIGLGGRKKEITISDTARPKIGRAL